METAVLQYIIESYFTRSQLQAIIPGDNVVKDAVEAILCEDPEGMEICHQLDQASEHQREKIRSMPPRELRSSLSVEFLEPGRRLSLILWALLQDDRLSARTLASQITEHFASASPEETETISATPLHREMHEEPLDVVPVESSDEPCSEISDEDLGMDKFLADLNSDDSIELGLPDEDEMFPSKDTLEQMNSIPEEISFMDESTSAEFDSILNSLNEEEAEPLNLKLDDLEQALDQHVPKSFSLSDLESEPNLDLGLDFGSEIDFETNFDEKSDMDLKSDLDLDVDLELETEPEFALKPEPAFDLETDLNLEPEPEPEIETFHFSTIDEDTLDKELGDMAEIESLLTDAENEEMIPIEDLINEEMKCPFPEESSVKTPSIDRTPPPKTDPEREMVSLGGVEISLGSLKTACEKIFAEPVELVVDKNLTENDQIVVVGKRCGVRVLHGPRYEIFTEEKLLPALDEPITVSPVSMQAALSKIYNETVELVPDPKLLKSGIIIFAGRETGISVVHNKSLIVPTPPWVSDDVLESMEDDSQAIKDELFELQNRFSSLQTEFASLNSSLDQRFEAVSQMIPVLPPTAQPPVQQQFVPPPAPIQPQIVVPVPAPEPVYTPAAGSVAAEAISAEDIETEELEPIHEPDDDLLASLKLDVFDSSSALSPGIGENIPPDDQDGTGISMDTLDALTEEIPTEDLLGENILGDDILGEDLLGEDLIGGEISLDEFNLDDLEKETSEEPGAGTADQKPAAAGKDELGLGEIGTDSFDLDSLDLDGLDGLDGLSDQDSTSSLLDTENDNGSSSFDLDLDVLAELDLDEENSFAPKEVLNGERILLLGGDTKNQKEYYRIIKEIGGEPEWRGDLYAASEEDIAEIVNNADIIMTLSSEALSDPGILQATNYAQENNKRLFQHHSANPVSVQKQLVKLVEEGKV